MSGRAGRRGLDERGTVITMIQEKTDVAKVRERVDLGVYLGCISACISARISACISARISAYISGIYLAQVREMLTGAADELSSRFHLSYNMLLNCVRVETADIEVRDRGHRTQTPRYIRDRDRGH